MIDYLLLAAGLSAGPAATPSAPLRVVDEQRRPVAEARVRVWLVPAGEADVLALVAPVCDTTSNEEGQVRCALPLGHELVVSTDAPAFAPAVLRTVATSKLELMLSAGQVLTGRIAEPAGIAADALRAARLRATARIEVPELRRVLEFDRVGQVEPDGRLVIAALPSSGVRVRLDVPGFLSWIAQLADAQPLRPVLVPGIVLRGATLDRAGRPVEGTQVEVDATDEPPRATSDEEGRFEIAVARLPVTLAFAASGYRTTKLEVQASEPEVVARLEPGQGVRGVLLDPHQRPVASAKLWHEHSEDGRTLKDEQELKLRDGAFKVDLAQAGQYTFRIEAPGFRPEPTGKVEVAAGEHLDLGVLRLHTGAGVTGDLVDERDGKPVPGALVELRPQGVGLVEEVMYHHALRTVSDGQGHFTLTGAAEGSYLLQIAAPGVGKAWRELDLAEDIVEQLGTVTVSSGVAVSGTVQTRAGTPVSGASVRWFDAGAASVNPLAETTTGEDGGFTLRLPPGTYLVRVVGSRAVLAEQVEISAAEKEQEVKLVSPGVRLSGVVMRAGTPVSGGSIRFTDALDPSSHRGKVILSFGPEKKLSGVTSGFPDSSVFVEVGPDGRFVVADASVGRLHASYLGTDGAYWSRELVVPDQPEATVVIDLDGVALSGAVVDDRGVPVEAATVTLLSPSGDQLRQAESGTDGAFRFDDLEPATYSLSARATGYRANELQGVRVAADQPNHVILTLTPGTSGSLAVQFWRSGGRPAAFVPVTLLDRSGRMVAALPTDSSGQRVFSELTAGDYVVAWSDPYAGAGASGELRVDAEARARFERVLEPGVAVNVHCALPACPSMQVGSLQLLTPLGLDVAPLLPVISPRLRFSGDGWFRLGMVSPGSYTLQMLVGATPYRRVLLLSSGEVTVELP